MRLMVYSHDTFGLGNIRRMLAICTHLRREIPDLSVLIVSGSPMLQSFRIQQGIDYIKLPCLKRTEDGALGVRFLDLELEEIVRLRRELILATVVSFKPDLVLVDKKPDGLAAELEPTLRYVKCNLPETKIMLVLRDILDSAETTIRVWQAHGFYNTVRWYYDNVLVLGSEDRFDVCKEYRFSQALSRKVTYCGYIAREDTLRSVDEIRNELGISEREQLLLVTAGGGEDGFNLIDTSIRAIRDIAEIYPCKTLVVIGPEMSAEHANSLRGAAANCSQIRVVEFLQDIFSYMNAADVVISMGGYNTFCELLSLGKRAVIVPRVHPVKEQKIRAERMADQPGMRFIMPEHLTPTGLGDLLRHQLIQAKTARSVEATADMGALQRIAEIVRQLCLCEPRQTLPAPFAEMVSQ